MLGAHFDSVAAGTGATDNATGSAAMMEALRILKAVGAKPRRTIRIGLWGGEEQGLLGSRAYVREHFGDPATMTLKPAHEKLSAYFNSDNGTGRVRGIWLQGNPAVEPIFRQWMEPLKDLGVIAIGPRSVASTDHVSFDAVGLPGVSVHGRSPRIQLAHASLEHGHVRSRAGRRHDPAGDGHRRLRLQRRDARREAAAESGGAAIDRAPKLTAGRATVERGYGPVGSSTPVRKVEPCHRVRMPQRGWLAWALGRFAGKATCARYLPLPRRLRGAPRDGDQARRPACATCQRHGSQGRKTTRGIAPLAFRLTQRARLALGPRPPSLAAASASEARHGLPPARAGRIARASSRRDGVHIAYPCRVTTTRNVGGDGLDAGVDVGGGPAGAGADAEEHGRRAAGLRPPLPRRRLRHPRALPRPRPRRRPHEPPVARPRGRRASCARSSKATACASSSAWRRRRSRGGCRSTRRRCAPSARWAR